MKFYIIWDSQIPNLNIELSGEFDVNDLERCYRQILEHEQWHTGMDILWDVRNCSLTNLSVNDLKAIAWMTDKYKDRRGKGKAAWVISRDVDFGVSRMFELVNQGKLNYNFYVFKSIREAKDWIITNK